MASPLASRAARQPGTALWAAPPSIGKGPPPSLGAPAPRGVCSPLALAPSCCPGLSALSSLLDFHYFRCYVATSLRPPLSLLDAHPAPLPGLARSPRGQPPPTERCAGVERNDCRSGTRAGSAPGPPAARPPARPAPRATRQPEAERDGGRGGGGVRGAEWRTPRAVRAPRGRQVVLKQCLRPAFPRGVSGQRSGGRRGST